MPPARCFGRFLVGPWTAVCTGAAAALLLPLVVIVLHMMAGDEGL